MKKIIFPLIILLSVLAGCTNLDSDESVGSKVIELQSQIDMYEATINDIKDELVSKERYLSIYTEQRDNCLKFINASIKYLDDKELSILAKDEWNYSIEIDDKPINFDTNFTIDKNSFKISYIEGTTGLSTMVPEIFENGKISGNFYEHLEFINVQPAKTDITDGTVVQAMIYQFENVPDGTIIKLQISDELKERLDLRSNILSIEID